jgi:hypothetical protein
MKASQRILLWSFPTLLSAGYKGSSLNVKRPASVKGVSQYASKSTSLTSGLLVVMTLCSCEYSGFTLTFFAFVFFFFLSSEVVRLVFQFICKEIPPFYNFFPFTGRKG